jgi:hypothetical protein
VEYVLYSGLCSAVFVTLVVAARRRLHLPRSKRYHAVVGWGLSYVVGLWFFWGVGSQAGGEYVGVAVPGAISAILLWRFTESGVVFVTTLAATLLASLFMLVPDDARYLIAPAVWLLLVAGSLLLPRWNVAPVEHPGEVIDDK